MNLPAKTIASNLNKRGRLRIDQFMACCPAHDHRNLSITIARDESKAYLPRPMRPSCLMQQLEFSDFENWLTESAAAKYLESDIKTFRDLRSGHWQGFVPYRRIGRRICYLRADLDGWLSNNVKRNAEKHLGKH